MKIRKLFYDEYGEREWFIIVKGVLFILVFFGSTALVLSAIYSSMPKPYEGKLCNCECQEEKE